MKTHKFILLLLILPILFNSKIAIGQSIDSLQIEKEFTQLEEAMKAPETNFPWDYQNL
jgi:hypothetical protein